MNKSFYMFLSFILQMIINERKNDKNLYILISCEDVHQATNILWLIKVHIFRKRLLVELIITFNYTWHLFIEQVSLIEQYFISYSERFATRQLIVFHMNNYVYPQDLVEHYMLQLDCPRSIELQPLVSSCRLRLKYKLSLV